MKILAVGYACSPTAGSEAGIGWEAVCRIASHHDVWVLTDIHNREGWNVGREEGRIPENVQVRFLRDRSQCSANRFIAHAQSWLNYWSFNRQVLTAAAKWHQDEQFDLCHQVTIAAWRMPSPLWRLPIPFVWGPIGGAGYIPPPFRKMLSTQSRVFEKARDLSSWLTLRSNAFRECIQHSAVVFAANEETDLLLKPHRGARAMIRLPSGSVSTLKAEAFKRPGDQVRKPGPLRLFAGGNMEGRKGISLALRALARVHHQGIDFHYTIAGGGPEIPAMIKLAGKLGLEDKVEFHPGFNGEDYRQALRDTDVYFLPSFRESTPATLLEAYLAGCYPVVADTSAQGEIVRMAGGTAVPVKDMEQLVAGLAAAVIDCAARQSGLAARAEQARLKILDYFSSHRFDNTLADGYQIATSQTS